MFSCVVNVMDYFVSNLDSTRSVHPQQPTCQTQPLQKTKLASQVLVHVMYTVGDKAAGHPVS